MKIKLHLFLFTFGIYGILNGHNPIINSSHNKFSNIPNWIKSVADFKTISTDELITKGFFFVLFNLLNQ